MNLFYVHSNITFLSALGTIEKLDLKDIFILFGRNYKSSFISNPYQCVYLNQEINELNQTASFGTWKPFWLFSRIKQLDTIIKENIHGTFNCYLPLASNFLMQSILTHPQCKEYNIIEEGMLSYIEHKKFIKTIHPYYSHPILGTFRRMLKYPMHFNRSLYVVNKNIKLGSIYLFYPDTSRYSEIEYIRLYFPKIKVTLPDLSGSNIFILDNPVNVGVYREDEYINVLTQIFNQIACPLLYIKFHPADNLNPKVLELLHSLQMKYEILNPELPLELIFAQSKNIKVFGIWSSLLFYAALSGHEVYSFQNIAKQINLKAKIWSEEHMPKIFNQYVSS